MSDHDHLKVREALGFIDINADPKELVKIFGDRFNDAWDQVANRKVIRYTFTPSDRVIWAVEGTNRDYHIYPNAPYCSCDDYFFAVIDGRALACKHLIAQRLAVALLNFQKKTLHDREYRQTLSNLHSMSKEESDNNRLLKNMDSFRSTDKNQEMSRIQVISDGLHYSVGRN